MSLATIRILQSSTSVHKNIRFGSVVTTLPVMFHPLDPHHTEHALEPGRILFANGCQNEPRKFSGVSVPGWPSTRTFSWLAT